MVNVPLRIMSDAHATETAKTPIATTAAVRLTIGVNASCAATSATSHPAGPTSRGSIHAAKKRWNAIVTSENNLHAVRFCRT